MILLYISSTSAKLRLDGEITRIIFHGKGNDRNVINVTPTSMLRIRKKLLLEFLHMVDARCSLQQKREDHSERQN